jgi:hypothetical protein
MENCVVFFITENPQLEAVMKLVQIQKGHQKKGGGPPRGIDWGRIQQGQAPEATDLLPRCPQASNKVTDSISIIDEVLRQNSLPDSTAA